MPFQINLELPRFNIELPRINMVPLSYLYVRFPYCPLMIGVDGNYLSIKYAEIIEDNYNEKENEK